MAGRFSGFLIDVLTLVILILSVIGTGTLAVYISYNHCHFGNNTTNSTSSDSTDVSGVAVLMSTSVLFPVSLNELIY